MIKNDLKVQLHCTSGRNSQHQQPWSLAQRTKGISYKGFPGRLQGEKPPNHKDSPAEKIHGQGVDGAES